MTTYLPINTVLGRMATLGRAMEDAFGVDNGAGAPDVAWSPAVNATVSEHAFDLTFDLPGVASDAVQVTFERNILTVSGTRAFTEKEGEQTLFAERPTGNFVRTLRFPAQVEADRVAATFKDGVLTVTVPKAEAAKPRKIAVT